MISYLTTDRVITHYMVVERLSDGQYALYIDYKKLFFHKVKMADNNPYTIRKHIDEALSDRHNDLCDQFGLDYKPYKGKYIIKITNTEQKNKNNNE